MSRLEVTATLQLPNEDDVEVLVDLEIHSWGSPGTGPSWNHPGDPPEGPEYDVLKITRQDNGEELWLEDLPQDIQDKLQESILEDIEEAQSDPDYDDYDRQ